MSTKNLARTVIEGGRGNTNARRFSHARHRRKVRQLLQPRHSDEDWDRISMPVLPWEGRWFSDKLSPAERWLFSQVGRQWDHVWSELMRTFDTRTTAGRHIVFCHLLPSVKGRYQWRGDFFVDARGTLCASPPGRRRPAERRARLEKQLLAWLNGRRMGQRGNVHVWLVRLSGRRFQEQQRLTPAETTTWTSLPGWVHQRFGAGARWREN